MFHVKICRQNTHTHTHMKLEHIIQSASQVTTSSPRWPTKLTPNLLLKKGTGFQWCLNNTYIYIFKMQYSWWISKLTALSEDCVQQCITFGIQGTLIWASRSASDGMEDWATKFKPVFKVSLETMDRSDMPTKQPRTVYRPSTFTNEPH